MPERHDDFYVGYKPQASAMVRGWVRKVIVVLFALAIVIPVLLAGAQSEFADSMFEFGTIKTFEGRLASKNYPVLHVEEGGTTRPYLLVEIGKHGTRHEFEGLNDRRVRLSGQLIHRGDQQMVELTADAVEPIGEQLAVEGQPMSFGIYELTGEILDSKCYLGVMKPGRGKPHRDCATRCISGGVPPLFVVTDREGNQLHLLPIGESEQPIGTDLLHLVAEPVSVEGEVIAREGLLYLLAPAENYRRIGDDGE